MIGFKDEKKNNDNISEVWISEVKVMDNNIERLENKISAQNLVIDEQRQTIEELRQELKAKKRIVADWLEPPVLSQKYTEGMGLPVAHEGYITINIVR